MLVAIYDRWSRPLYSLILRIVSNPDDANTVLIDVYKCFWEKSAKPEFLQGSLFGILWEMSRHCALDLVDSRGFRNGRQEWGAWQARDCYTDPSEFRGMERLPPVERSRQAKGALEGLTVEELALIEGAIYEGQSRARLALRTNQTSTVVQGQLATAMDKLVGSLGDMIA